MVIVTMLIAASLSAQQVVARNTAYMAKVKSLSVQVEATSNARPGVGRAFLLFKKPDSIAFDLKWGDEDYSLRANAKSILEVERVSRMYSEHQPTGALRLPPLDLSRGVGLSLPGMLMQKGLASAIPPKAELKYVGSEREQGVTTDRVRAQYKTPVAEVTIDAWVDAQGALRRYDLEVVQAGSRFTNSLRLSNYRINPPTTPRQFAMGLPIGFVPFVFDEEPAVIGQGRPLRIAGLTTTDGKPFDLSKWLAGKKTLVAVLGKGCAPSAALLSSLKTLAGGLRTVVIAPDKSVRAPGSLLLVDPKGNALQATGTPSTPLIALIDSRGAVQQVWLGFDKKSLNELSFEIRTISAQIK